MAKVSTLNQAQIDACDSYFEKLTLIKPERYSELSERDIAYIFSITSRSFCCYNPSRKKWMYYNGKYWEYDKCDIHVKQLAKSFSSDLRKYVASISISNDESLYKLSVELGDFSARKKLISDSIDNNVIDEEEFDTDIYLINLMNGTYDLRSNTLKPHSYKDRITRIANVSYSPTTQSDILDDFMDAVFSGDDRVIQYIYDLFGLCLSGEISPEAFWVFLGETTRNGKSTLLNTFAYMLGGTKGYSINCDISSLTRKKLYDGSAPSADIARLKGARLVIASEPPKDFLFDEAKIKSLTGGDRITARFLRANNIEFDPTFKIILASNHRPTICDDSILASNRLRIIPFLKHFSEEEQDKTLKVKLRDANVLSALLLKCIEGWNRYRAHGLIEPDIVCEAISEYKSPGQVFDLFIASYFEPCKGGVIALSDFYPKYEEFCTDNNFVIMNKAIVNEIMRAKGIFKSSGTINGKSHRNVLVGFKYKKDGLDTITVTGEPIQRSWPELSSFILEDATDVNDSDISVKGNSPQTVEIAMKTV